MDVPEGGTPNSAGAGDGAAHSQNTPIHDLRDEVVPQQHSNKNNSKDEEKTNLNTQADLNGTSSDDYSFNQNNHAQNEGVQEIERVEFYQFQSDEGSSFYTSSLDESDEEYRPPERRFLDELQQVRLDDQVPGPFEVRIERILQDEDWPGHQVLDLFKDHIDLLGSDSRLGTWGYPRLVDLKTNFLHKVHVVMNLEEHEDYGMYPFCEDPRNWTHPKTWDWNLMFQNMDGNLEILTRVTKLATARWMSRLDEGDAQNEEATRSKPSKIANRRKAKKQLKQHQMKAKQLYPDFKSDSSFEEDLEHEE